MKKLVKDDRAMSQKTVILESMREEIEMSEEIYKNLHALSFLHEPTVEFRKYFVKDMFVKSNPKAFLHVMHFLFNILDPVEFKKKFHWPLDKESENLFRSTSVVYLNELNEKHSLGLEPIKSYIVVMPGGKKFMKVLLKFSDMVMQEELRRRGKLNSNDMEDVIFSKSHMDKILQEKKICIEKGAEFIHKTEESIERMKTHIEQFKTLKSNLLAGMQFANDPNAMERLKKLYLAELVKNLSYIERFNTEYEQFTETIEAIKDCVKDRYIDLERSAIKNGPEKLESSLSDLPIHDGSQVLEEGKLNLNALFEMIFELLPIILMEIETNSKLNVDHMEFRNIEKMLQNFCSISKQINAWRSSWPESSIAEQNDTSCENSSGNSAQIQANVLQSPCLQWTGVNLDESCASINASQSSLLLTMRKKTDHQQSVMNSSRYLNIPTMGSGLDTAKMKRKFKLSNLEKSLAGKKKITKTRANEMNHSPLHEHLLQEKPIYRSSVPWELNSSMESVASDQSTLTTFNHLDTNRLGPDRFCEMFQGACSTARKNEVADFDNTMDEDPEMTIRPSTSNAVTSQHQNPILSNDSPSSVEDTLLDTSDTLLNEVLL